MQVVQAICGCDALGMNGNAPVLVVDMWPRFRSAGSELQRSATAIILNLFGLKR